MSAGAAGHAPIVHDLSGALALDELIAAIDGAALLVSNNSGPVHIAAARRTPVVDLYALTNPQHTPWQRAAPRAVEGRAVRELPAAASARKHITPA